ncbi:MAG TPA: 2'-5' RNA ligase family protein [Mycobacteriales bacterium]|nr:2'-5' RNA ligase family protein [Mycobacteriales bacterium]
MRSIGVAIGLPEPYNSELQRWRERLGDPNAARIPPHVTLLPPTEVPPDSLPDIEEHLRVVATDEQDFDIHLRGSATFRPVSPVVFVPLVQGISECERLESKVRSGPLGREIRFPYHPHVTVAHELPAEALDGAFQALASYEADFRVHGFSLFEQGADGTWRPQRDFVFGGGGLPGPEAAPPEPVPRTDGW